MPLCRPSSDDFVALGNQVFDSETHIRERICVHGDELPISLIARFAYPSMSNVVQRQGVHTAATLDTTHVEINVDGMPPVTTDDVMPACSEVEELVEQFCSGEARIETLSKDSSVLLLEC